MSRIWKSPEIWKNIWNFQFFPEIEESIPFLEKKGKTQSRSQLLNDVWGYEEKVSTRTVDTHVKRLRDNIEKTQI